MPTVLEQQQAVEEPPMSVKNASREARIKRIGKHLIHLGKRYEVMYTGGKVQYQYFTAGGSIMAGRFEFNQGRRCMTSKRFWRQYKGVGPLIAAHCVAEYKRRWGGKYPQDETRDK